MPARNLYHGTVRKALTKDGWTITHDPYSLKWGDRDLFIDLGAEAVLGAEQAGRLIAVEIQSFVSKSEMDDFERAVGQYSVYRTILAEQEPDRVLYLAVPDHVILNVFEDPVGELVLSQYPMSLIGFDPQTEEITRWIP